MPSNWMAIDSNFPSFTGEESPTEQIRALHNYLFQLREGLRYSLQNLTQENFNTAALENMNAEQRDALVTELQKVYTVLSQLSTQVESISGRVSGVEALGGKLDGAEGRIDALETWKEEIQPDVAGIQTGLTEAEGRIETLEQDVTDNKALIDALAERVEEIEPLATVIRLEEDGSVTIVTGGAPLRLVGQVYINDTLY